MIYPMKINKWIKYYIYFVIGYAIFIVIAHIHIRLGILLGLCYAGILHTIHTKKKGRGVVYKRFG
jgi:hypothetical protein